MTQTKVTKAVIAAAGLGTRFLPQTKAMPKEMLPLIDKPIIQHIVEELTAAGITDIVIVTGYHKRAIEDHFDQISADLRNSLEAAGKDELLQVTSAVGDLANFAYIRQKGPYGTGTPLLNAAHLIGNEPFIYTFADDFVQAGPSRFTQLIEAYAERSGTILTAVQRDGDADYGRYGYVAGTDLGGGIVDVATIIEKPGSREAAPSSLASVSGYVFDPTILEYLQNQLKTYDGSREFMMQESIQQMIDDGHHVYAVEVKNGTYYDTGNPLEYLKTVFDFALEREGIGLELADFLRNKLQ
jgi:UTP--glucose-1-phosphate uridylyltransferase